MRVRCWFILLSCLMYHPVSAQRKHWTIPRYSSRMPLNVKEGERVKEVFFNASCGYNYFYNIRNNGVLEVSFPYSTYNSTTTNSATFSSSVVSPFSSALSQYELNMQAGSRNNYIDASGGYTGYGGWWSLGYGRTLFEIRRFPKTIYVKMSLSVARYTFQQSMGSFPAKGMWYEALGNKRDSIYTKGYDPSMKDLKKVERVNVRYVEETWSLQPKISVEWHPFKNNFFIEGAVAYSLSISEQSRVVLERASSSGVEPFPPEFILTSTGLTTRYNGVRLTESPFHLRGVQFGIKVGFTLHRFKIRRNFRP